MMLIDDSKTVPVYEDIYAAECLRWPGIAAADNLASMRDARVSVLVTMPQLFE
jgi:hypothetical protein